MCPEQDVTHVSGRSHLSFQDVAPESTDGRELEQLEMQPLCSHLVHRSDPQVTLAARSLAAEDPGGSPTHI